MNQFLGHIPPWGCLPQHHVSTPVEPVFNVINYVDSMPPVEVQMNHFKISPSCGQFSGSQVLALIVSRGAVTELDFAKFPHESLPIPSSFVLLWSLLLGKYI